MVAPAAALALRPAYLSYEALRARADACLKRCGWRGELPINVERMMDVSLGLNIVADPSTKDWTEADGFLSRDRTTVYVHEYTQRWLQNRFRFTLAHELGHYVLHVGLHRAVIFSSFEEWQAFVNSMPENVRARYEVQADHFAGLFLVPRAPLQGVIAEAKRRVRGPFADVDLREEEERALIVAEAARRFEVSGAVIELRGKLEGWW